MWFIKELLIFWAGLILPFIVGPIDATFGFIALGVWLFYFLPRGARATVKFRAQQDIRERKLRIETQLRQGVMDGQLINEVAADLRQRGEL